MQFRMGSIAFCIKPVQDCGMKRLQLLMAGVLGALLGGGAAAWLVVERERPPAPEADEPAVELLDQRDEELQILRARVRQQGELIARLEEALASAAAAPAVEAEPAEPAEDPRAAFEQRMAERIGQRVDGRVGEMASKYGLDAAQQEALKDVFLRRMEHFRALRSGEAAGAFNLDQEISKVLTPAQFADYLAESQQEIYNRAELLATNQVVRLAQLTPLAPEIEDSVYEAVHLTAQEMMIAHQSGEGYDMRAVLDERLGSVLTEEQMSVYRENASSFGTGRGGGGGGGGGGRGLFGP